MAILLYRFTHLKFLSFCAAKVIPQNSMKAMEIAILQLIPSRIVCETIQVKRKLWKGAFTFTFVQTQVAFYQNWTDIN